MEKQQLWFGLSMWNPQQVDAVKGLVNALVSEFPQILVGGRVLSKTDLRLLNEAEHEEAKDLFDQDPSMMVAVGFLFSNSVEVSTTEENGVLSVHLNNTEGDLLTTLEKKINNLLGIKPWQS